MKKLAYAIALVIGLSAAATACSDDDFSQDAGPGQDLAVDLGPQDLAQGTD
jgi:hypothetical protein